MTERLSDIISYDYPLLPTTAYFVTEDDGKGAWWHFFIECECGWRGERALRLVGPLPYLIVGTGEKECFRRRLREANDHKCDRTESRWTRVNW